MLKQVAPEKSIPECFNEIDNEYLNERLLIKNEEKDPKFLPVYKDGEKNALGHQPVLSQLKEDLPSLNFIVVSEKGESEILLVREQKLNARLDAFLAKSPLQSAN